MKSDGSRANGLFSKKSLYALHAIVYIAENNTTVTASEICDAKNIPKKFLSNILSELKKAGILGSKPGKTGGFSLLRSTAKVSFFDIITIIDGMSTLLPCLSPGTPACYTCSSTHHCIIHSTVSHAQNNFHNKLKSITIASLCHPAEKNLTNNAKPIVIQL